MKLQFDATPAKVAQLVNPKISHKEQPSYANLSTDASVWEQKLKVQDSQLSAYLNLFKLVVKGEKLDLAPQLSAISHEDYKEPQHMVQFVPQVSMHTQTINCSQNESKEHNHRMRFVCESPNFL